VDAILLTPVNGNGEDFWAWAPEKHGVYSVKSAYRLLEANRKQVVEDEASGSSSSHDWQTLWKLVLGRFQPRPVKSSPSLPLHICCRPDRGRPPYSWLVDPVTPLYKSQGQHTNQGPSVNLGNPKRSDLLSAVSDGKLHCLASLPPSSSPTRHHRSTEGHGVVLIVVQD
jgi:hypothetical protein